MALSLQAYLIKSALQPPDYSFGTSAPEQGNDFLSVLLPMIVFAVVLLRRLKANEKYTFRPMDIGFLVMGGVLLLGSLYSPLQLKGLLMTAKYFALGISFYFIARLWLSKHTDFRRAVVTFMNTTWLLAMILGTYAYIVSFNIPHSRLTLGSSHPIPFSLLLAIGLVIHFSWFLKKSPFRLRLLQVIGFIVLLIIFIDSNTRGTIFAAVIAITVMLVSYSIYNGGFRKVLLLVPMVIGGVLLAGYFNPAMAEKVTTNLQLITSDEQGQSIDDRKSAYNEAWNLFKENPVFGLGTGGFETKSELDYPHNVFLEQMSENGLIGFLVLLAFILMSLLLAVKTIQLRNPAGYLIAALVILNVVEMQFSFTLWMHKSFFISCGIMAAYYYKTKHQVQVAA